MNKNKVSILIASLVFLYALIGAFPFARFETDSMAIANASQHMINTGVIKENLLGHSYHMQSGTYFLIIIVSKIFGISTFLSYSWITFIAWVFFFIFVLLFLKNLSGEKYWVVIIILFLFPEMTAIGYYANSAIIAGAFWMAGNYLILSKVNKWTIMGAGIFYGLAAWMRVDVAFVFPSVLILIYWQTKNIKRSLIFSFLIAIIAIPVTLLLMQAMHAHVSGFLGYTSGHWKLYGMNNGLGVMDKSLIRSHIAFFPVLLLFMIVYAVVLLIRKKQWMVLLFLFSGIVFYYLLGINNNVAPKHLSYFVPFWALLILASYKYFRNIKRKSKRYIYLIFTILFIAQYMIGYQVDIKSLPYVNKNNSVLQPEPTLVVLKQIKHPVKSIENVIIVLGTGTKIPTADELMASSGLLFSPVMWNVQKDKLYKSFSLLSDFIKKYRSDTMHILITDGSSQFTINALMSKGYKWNEKLSDFRSDTMIFCFEKGNRKVVLHRMMEFRKFDKLSFERNFMRMPANTFIAVFLWDWQNYMIREELQRSYSRAIGNNAYMISK